MIQAIINVFRIPELRNKLLFTFAMLAVYRIGYWIPVPGVNQQALVRFFEQQVDTGGAFSRLAQYVAIFSGGDLGRSTIFGLGIMPYISAAIIFQLLKAVIPKLKELEQEGPSGRQKVQEWTRYTTIGLCIVQAFAWLQFLTRAEGVGLVYPWWAPNPVWWVMAITALTAGTVFLMWLGEQIDRYGIGNGVSLIIMAGILTEMPGAAMQVYANFEPGDPAAMGWMGLFLLMGGFVLVVCGAVVMTVAQRRIPIQQAKHTRGRKVYGGQRSYLPLRVNHGGVMPIIFASSLMIFPAVVFEMLTGQVEAAGAPTWMLATTRWFGDNFNFGEFPYVALYIVMVYFFSYFWITVQFNPEDMSKQLKEHGSFIPGLRPGPRTAEYLETVMERITFVGAGFLAVIAVLPMVVNRGLNISFIVTQFLGGTGLLIVVSVGLDFIQRIEANLLMRNYAGFLGGGDEAQAARGRGRSY
jgi:preprotein translocase subunit SecY